MLVKAAPGLKVPREDKPRVYITEADPVEVPKSTYYLRRLAEGDLVRAAVAVEPAAAAKPQQAAKTADKKE